MNVKQRKKKPDLLAVLVICIGLGVIATSLAQAMLNTPDTEARLTSSAQVVAESINREQ